MTLLQEHKEKEDYIGKKFLKFREVCFVVSRSFGCDTNTGVTSHSHSPQCTLLAGKCSDTAMAVLGE